MPARPGSRVRDALIIIGVFAVAGTASGLLWELLWTPPTGLVHEGRFVMDGPALRADFAATGSYVLIGSAVGLVLGLFLTAVFDHDELVTLASVAAGAALAGWLMREVGGLVGPADPQVLARTLDDFTELPNNLAVHTGALVALPAGALSGALVVLFGFTRRGGHPRGGADPDP